MTKTTKKCPDCVDGKTIGRNKRGQPAMIDCKRCKGTGKIRKQKVAPVAVIDDDDDEDDMPVQTKAVVTHARSVKLGKLDEEQRLAKDTIEERASFFGCPGKVVGVRKGPIITLYEFAPAKTTRVKRLQNLQEDLALALSAEAVMVRRVPGKDIMGIEISNEESERQNVAFRASLKNILKAKQAGMELPLNLGTDPFGEPIIDDLATMPHLLIAGSTGTGKSVSLNCLISSLLAVCSPQELEFYMIDPKGVELTHYNGIPHMKESMVTSPHYAKQMLETLIQEMRRRLMVLTREGVRDIKELNDKFKPLGKALIPRIVLIVDELGDLMMQDRREFTRMFAEISQIARATGIHMICATQRPSVDVLSGKIKVNFPGRMAFKVTSATDSRTIVHRKGAEGLLGRGDMLYQGPTRSALIRIHAPWVPLNDVRELVGKIKKAEEERLAAERAKLAEVEAQRRREIEQRMAANPPAPSGLLRRDEKEDMDIELSWLSRTEPVKGVLPINRNPGK